MTLSVYVTYQNYKHYKSKNTLPSCHTKGYFISDYFIFCKAQTPRMDSE